jgi:hypothetical protein
MPNGKTRNHFDEINGVHADQCEAFLRDIKPATSSLTSLWLIKADPHRDGSISLRPAADITG